MGVDFSHLNPCQREAVFHSTGPLLILAGAGSGKTSTMAYRIAHLLEEKNIRPTAILGLSFTNKAAHELKARVSQLLAGKMSTRGLWITTFHSLGARVLREHADRLGFQKHFTILDQNDRVDILKQVLKHIRIDDRKFDAEALLFAISQAKNQFLCGEEAEAFFDRFSGFSPEMVLAASCSFPKYQEQLKLLNAMDFDDLIYYTVLLLEQDASVCRAYNDRFEYLLVDEYQDTNASQFRILQCLTQKQQNLCVVGDDDQSIYSWRGADPSHILSFSKHYPQSKKVALEQNYRSTSTILHAANAVIGQNPIRYPKKLWSDRGEGSLIFHVVVAEDRAEAEYVSEKILEKKQEGYAWKDFAILYRSNAQSRVFEEALRRKGIAYKILGGISFLARKEVKDVLAYWKLLCNFKDDASLRRVINWPQRGIGKTTQEALGTLAFAQEISVFEALNRYVDARATPRLQAFQQWLQHTRAQLEASSPEMLVAWARSCLESLGIKQAIAEEADDPIQASRRWENVEELLHSLGQWKSQGSTALEVLSEYLVGMMLQAQEPEGEEKDLDQVTLLTLHGAKGLEYRVVFLVGMEEGFLPHKRTLNELVDLSEERRLCYVGITRARDELFFVRAHERIRYGKPVPCHPSRFLAAIPQELLQQVNQVQLLKPQEDALQVKSYLDQIRARLGAS
jgi:superfamily I DNA/RNA helicase